MSAVHGHMVLLPFNALSLRGCSEETRGLWSSALQMFKEQYAEYPGMGCPYSLQFYLRDRFHLRDWSPERISKERSAFLNEETCQNVRDQSGITWMRHGFVAVDLYQHRVMGEINIAHMKDDTAVVDGLDYLRPNERGKGLGLPLLRLFCHQAASMGFAKLCSGVHIDNVQSAKCLDHLVEEGKATRLPDRLRNGHVLGRRFEVDLAHFK